METRNAQSNPVFLVGIIRSGTSLLYALLNLHPQVALMYECDVWNFPWRFSKMRFQRNWLERQEFYNLAVSRHRLNLGQSMRGLEKIGTPEDLYRVYAEGKGALLWGEKSPHDCVRLLQLARSYPNASFIFLWRNSSEIYRSVIRAGWNDRFFRQRGIVHRIIFDQEQMISAVSAFSKAGMRIHHVTYDGLTHETEKTCRGLCHFLQIEFDQKMLGLNDADLSAVYRDDHHQHLRNRVVGKREFAAEVADQPTLMKLQRFQARWNRLTRSWVSNTDADPLAAEPSMIVCVAHRAGGFLFHTADGIKRLAFEFLPLPWFRSYRSIKQAWLVRRAESPRISIGQQLAEHGLTIFLSYLVLALIGIADFCTGMNVTFAPFYAIPVAILTLVINLRWGKWAAMFAATVWSVAQIPINLETYKLGVIAWNSIMRFLILVAVAAPLDRLHCEKKSADEKPLLEKNQWTG